MKREQARGLIGGYDTARRNNADHPLPALSPLLTRGRKRFVDRLQQRATDHDSLHLGRSFTDLAEQRVAPESLDGYVARVTVSAVNLERTVADPRGRFGSVEFRHRRLT